MVKSVTALAKTTLITIPFTNYEHFAYAERTFTQMQEILKKLIPSFQMKSKNKRQSIVNNFEEVCLEDNTLLEIEGSSPRYLWFILNGEVDIYKRPESLYDKHGKPTDCKNLQLWQNPADSGNQSIGVKVGIIKDKNFVCEDALFFNQPLIYSMRCKHTVLAWRYKAEDCLKNFSDEFHNELRIQSLRKYQWLFQRLDRIEVQLNKISNYGELVLAKQVETRANLNFP
jgi:CRP-like cAMP-binding protein